MWEVRDGDSRVVLFGSVHALPPDVDWRTPLLDQAIADAPLIYFETDIGPLGMASMMVKIIVQQFQTIGEPWLDRLNGEQMHKLLVAIEPLGISLGEAGATPVEENDILAAGLNNRKLTTHVVEVEAQVMDSRLTDGHQALFVAFPDNPDKADVGIEVGQL